MHIVAFTLKPLSEYSLHLTKKIFVKNPKACKVYLKPF